MTNVAVALELTGTALDLGRIQAPDAIVTGNTITWKAATNKDLSVVSPNQDGELTFTVPLKSSLSTNLKNQVIRSVASIASDQMPKSIRAADLELQLASKLGLSITGAYVSGSLPMKVGESTVFAITCLLTNQSNDLSGTEVIMSMPLPPNAWQNVVQPAAETNNVTFDPNASKIRWKVGLLSAFTGRFIPARAITMQLQVTPTEADVGKTMTLLRDINAEGLDTFINQVISVEDVQDLTTGNLDDPQVNQAGGNVQ